MKFKLINIFFLFCFFIPFSLSVYINVASAYDIAEQETENKEPDIEDTPVTTPTIIDLSKKDVPVFSVQDYVSPDFLQDETSIVKVYNKTNNEVIEMNIHDYLICAVAGEMPATFNIEALKAQAVAARTFTVKHMSGACSSNTNAHVCTYYGCCQAFVSQEQMKKNWGSLYEEKYATIKAAVELTDGLVMLHNGSPITVFYFSTSNGYTDACQDVFVKTLPYYKSVKSPGEETASGFYSSKTVTKEEFVSTLKRELNISITADKLEESITITRTDGGRVAKITFGEKSVKGTQMRTAFGLKSADFHLTFDKDNILIEVYGYGHGVGMSQLGAEFMAQNGNDFQDILLHYYIGVDIIKY